jgi:hypothetical protein
MKPKKILIFVIIIVLIAIKGGAYALSFFSGWSRVIETSPDILVVTCWNPTPPTPGVDEAGPKSDYQSEVLSVLKGTNKATSVRLRTDHELQSGHAYLVFGQYFSGGFDAFEDYRVIPLDKGFDLKSLKDKTLDEKLQILFQSGVNYMNQKIQDDEATKERLEQASQK